MRGLGILGAVLIAGCSSAGADAVDSAAASGEGGEAAPGSAGAIEPSSTGSSSMGGAARGGASGMGGSSGSAAHGGGSSQGGTSNGGASQGGSNAGSAGMGNAGSGGAPFVPPSCKDPAQWPSNAPALVPGKWVDIAPMPHFYANGIVFGLCNPAILYTAGGNYPSSGGPGDNLGVFRSTDAGASWTKLNALDSSAHPRVDPKDPNHLYVIDGVNGSTQGFWRSTDGGKTWEIPAGFKKAADSVNDYDTYDVNTDPADFNHVLVTFHWYWHSCSDYGFGGCNSGLFESTDGGDTWILHDPKPEWAGGGGYNAYFLHEPTLGIGDSNTWLYGTQGKGYWRTSDAGKTWAKVTPIGMSHGGGQIYYSKQKVLYLASAGGVLKSTDNGLSWSVIAPSNYYLGIVGDGTNLYSGFNVGNGGKFVTAKENNDGVWTDYNSQTFGQGPYEMSFDAAHGIVYSSNAPGGLWALKAK